MGRANFVRPRRPYNPCAFVLPDPHTRCTRYSPSQLLVFYVRVYNYNYIQLASSELSKSFPEVKSLARFPSAPKTRLVTGGALIPVPQGISLPEQYARNALMVGGARSRDVNCRQNYKYKILYIRGTFVEYFFF